MPNVIVIGNCQAAPLAHMLEQLPDIATARSIAVHERGSKRFAEIDAELQPLLDRADTHVFTFPVKGEHGGYSTDELRQRTAKVKTITNLFFDGLHPDVTYVGQMSARLQSPLGDYHSKIILDAFCEGRSEAECRAMFNAAEYERRGYFQAYDRSAKELLARDKDVDVPFAKEFLGLVRQFPTLMTFNHPTSVVFQAYGVRLAKELGLTLPQFPAPYVKNPLAGSVLWPVYKELAQAHGLKYGTPMVFRQADSRGGCFFGLPDLIKRSYALYTHLGDALKAAWSTPATATESL
ncbi:hypothetical protein LRH25_11355 [Ideonella azotifigens]|uniref:Polysaccharide biosynthesis enzyme WcbI domain-containing protein n=1 Tax=Ideonella azotifigens TaxID=513160 RepID=A0ABN1JSP8_9BURK|nr:WcbI family polysaccharide biosynthesis putative acetyltransferase [Ideonella azotifigens]MCD2340938.1 hypothetical protein [Ideonella azotifigens]